MRRDSIRHLLIWTMLLAPVTAGADLSITKTDLPDPVVAGTDLTYTITATNSGPGDTPDVEISDPLPPGTTFVSATPSAGAACSSPPVGGAGTVTCTWAGATGAGVARTLTLVVHVDPGVLHGSTITNTATAVSSVLAIDASADTLVINRSSLAVTKDDVPDPVIAGEDITYTITATNNGPSVASNIQISDPLPPSTTLVSATPSAGGGCMSPPVGETGTVTCTWAGITGVGVVRTLTLAVYVPLTAADGSTVTNTARAIPSVLANDATADTLVINQADLSVTKDDGVTTAVPGGSVTYVITTTNSGPSDAVGVTIADLFPPELTCLWTCTATGSASCGGGGTVDEVEPNNTVAGAQDLDPAGWSLNFDPNIGDTTSNTSTTIPHLTILGTGDNTFDHYALTVANAGDLGIFDIDFGTAGGFIDSYLRLYDSGATLLASDDDSSPSDGQGGSTSSLDSFLQFTFPAPGVYVIEVGRCCVSTVPAGGDYQLQISIENHAAGTAGAGDVNDVVDVPVGDSVIITAVCDVDPSATGTLTNAATVTAPAGVTDPDPANNSATDADVLTPVADLSVMKDDSQDPAAAGDPLRYTVTLTNAGPSDATFVTAFDTLPAEVGLVSTSGCANDPNGVPACTLGTIPAGGSAAYTVDVVVDDSTPDGATITNTARFAAASSDPDPAGDVATEDTLIDALPPIVTLVDSVAGTGDGMLAECEEAKVAVTGLLVSFSEAVQDPLGDTDPSDVTNPANYRLVAAGADGDFTTTVCGPAIGDDSAVAVDAVSYNAATLTATLAVGGGTPLSDALHRLLVCGSTSIRDLAGNALDGNFDGVRGDDFLRTYRVDRANLFAGGHFDCQIEPWLAVSNLPGEIEYSTDDVDDSLVSGSAQVTNLSAGSDFSLGQCLAVAGGSTYGLSGSARADVASGVTLFLSRVCDFFADPACAGPALLTELDFALLGDTGGDWTPVASDLAAPAAATSALCSFDLTSPAGDVFDANLDELDLRLLDGGPSKIFSDDLESGDMSRWSSSVH